MTIASLIIQPAPGKLDQAAAELAAIDGVSVHTTTPDQQIIILVEAPSLGAVSEIARRIERQLSVSGVYPAYVHEET